MLCCLIFLLNIVLKANISSDCIVSFTGIRGSFEPPLSRFHPAGHEPGRRCGQPETAGAAHTDSCIEGAGTNTWRLWCIWLSNVSGTSGNRLLWYQSKCYTLSLSAGTFIHLCVSTQVSSYCRLTVYSNMAQCPAVVRWAKIVNELLGMLEFSHCIRFCQRFSRSWGFTHWNSSWIDSADILPHLSNTLCKKWVCQGSMSHTQFA